MKQFLIAVSASVVSAIIIHLINRRRDDILKKSEKLSALYGMNVSEFNV